MQIAPTISPAILPAVLSAENRHPALLGGVPKDGLICYAKAPGLTDSIGLSAAALWAALPITHRSIYLVDENTLRSGEAIITNIEASEYLNDGGELVGTEAKGYAQYEDGTSEEVIRRAFRFFGIAWPFIYLTDIDGNYITDTDLNNLEGTI
jgi:hypothetical protein